MRHLWQRIFAYSLLLIVLSQGAVFWLHTQAVNKDEARRFVAENAVSLAAAMDGGTFASADSVAKIFNRRASRVWLENAAGEVVVGAPPANRPVAGSYPAPDPGGGPVLVEMNDARGTIVAVMAITLRDSDATLFLRFGPPPGRGLWTMFLRGLMVLSCIGVALALWMAWSVSRPLRVLRGEVLEIAGGSLDRRVTVSGGDEIADVAAAVNQMADSLAKNIRSMRELVANISHEMRSPLARMQVSLALLEEDVATVFPAAPQAAARLALIAEELDHMNKLIGATLLSSKLDLQGGGDMTAPVAFSELCAEMARRHEPVFAKRGVRFVRKITPEVVFPGDETLLSNLVSNVLENAAKYTAPGGTALMRLYASNGAAVLEVENTHAPIAENVLDHIFEPFYRGGVATGNGVGLGLSLVAKIAALHGGATTAANTDTGVAFTVRFAAPSAES